MSIEDILLQQVQRNVDRAKRTKETSMEYAPSPGQMSNFAGMLAPGAGYADFFGEYPSLPDYEQPVTEAFSNEPYPSFAENLKRGGFGGYFDASMQGLGMAGDTLYAAPFVGPPLGGMLKGLGAFGAVMRAGSKAGKGAKTEEGIATLGKQPMFTPEDTLNLAYTPDGSFSPGIKDLIEKASPKLRGQGITQWANKNLKPKELEVLGIDEFIKANPKATLKETVEGISGNKVVVGKKVLGGGEGQVMDFETSYPLEDPLDGSPLHEFLTEDIEFELNPATASFQKGGVNYQATLDAQKEFTDEFINLARGKGYDFDGANISNYDEITKLYDNAKYGDGVNEVYDEAIDNLAMNLYQRQPYELIRPTGVDVGDNTFAFGDENVGYQIFVDGQRKTDPGNIAYSRTEAQIKLRDEMADEGYDMFRVDADDFDPDFDGFGGGTQYKQFIDRSLPGGKNYREIIYTYEDAPEGHNIGHFSDDIDEGNYLAHALVRDRKLADGTETLHGDELQSDLHRDGAKFGYNSLEQRKSIEEAKNIAEQNMSDSFDNLKPLLDKYDLSDLPESISAPSTSPVSADTLIYDVNKTFRDRGVLVSELPRDINEALVKYEDKAREIQKILDQENNLVPNYPYKEDYHVMLLKKMLLQAVEEGKPAISVSGSGPIKARYVSGNNEIDEKNFRFYESLYDKKIPSSMKKLTEKYGGEFQKNSKLDNIDTFGVDYKNNDLYQYSKPELWDANVIKITEEMRNKILLEGIPDFATGGIVNKGIAQLRTAKQPTEGIVDLGLY